MPIFDSEWDFTKFQDLPAYTGPYEHGEAIDEDDVVFIIVPGEFQYLICDVMTSPVKTQFGPIVHVSPVDSADDITVYVRDLQKLPTPKQINNRSSNLLDDETDRYAAISASEIGDDFNTNVYDYIVVASFGEYRAVDGNLQDDLPDLDGWKESKKRSYYGGEWSEEFERDRLIKDMMSEYAPNVPLPVRSNFFEYLTSVIEQEHEDKNFTWHTSGDIQVYYKPKEEE